ncbi:hypothetical protein ASG92_14805 [Arthrobacter sp. Soil736]|uniref:hypothetical protein n=1 Tax=Arthrobacter sp. Soil736 TaxID=1736395 RepID=UPI0006FA7057|nr:hypothetical protein [Arthrobacter sp. Soil736]KRE67561.1 hypothetical protein ASG92_14805 [Arthrobacter sp. Soil736]
MSDEPSPSVEPSPQNSRRRLLLAALAAVVVILAGIAVAVSVAPRAGQETAATVSATASQSPDPVASDPASSDKPTTLASQDAVNPQEAELLDEANTVCEMRLTEKYPTAAIQPGTKSAAKPTGGRFETTGTYTDAGSAAPQQFKCASVRSGGSWTVVLEQG